MVTSTLVGLKSSIEALAGQGANDKARSFCNPTT
jgi:hypothetical protein